MKRTTLVLDDDLFRKIKQEAARQGETLKEYLNSLLRWALSHKKAKPYKFKWKTVKGDLQPNVPIEDRDRLYDFFDENP